MRRCATFIVNCPWKVFDGNLISIVDLRLVLWGNGFIKSDGSMICQAKHFNFVYGMEWLTLPRRHGEWSRCLQSTGLGNAPIDCYYKGYGNQLELRNAVETAGLNPRHRSVPWVVVDNRPLEEDFPNFVSYICKAYPGGQSPTACGKSSTGNTISSKENDKLGLPICYTSEEASNTTTIHI